MIVWIDGPYGVGKSTLAEKLQELEPHSFLFDAEEVGNAVRENTPRELFCGYIFENYPLWFDFCVELLKDIDRALSTGNRIQSGWVQINQGGAQMVGQSYGGFKQSGLGREASLEGMLEGFTQIKQVNVKLR